MTDWDDFYAVLGFIVFPLAFVISTGLAMSFAIGITLQDMFAVAFFGQTRLSIPMELLHPIREHIRQVVTPTVVISFLVIVLAAVGVWLRSEVFN